MTQKMVNPKKYRKRKHYWT